MIENSLSKMSKSDAIYIGYFDNNLNQTRYNILKEMT
jgi:hypothetical protein